VTREKWDASVSVRFGGREHPHLKPIFLFRSIPVSQVLELNHGRKKDPPVPSCSVSSLHPKTHIEHQEYATSSKLLIAKKHMVVDQQFSLISFTNEQRRPN
jgi:hypothetical protein